MKSIILKALVVLVVLLGTQLTASTAKAKHVTINQQAAFLPFLPQLPSLPFPIRLDPDGDKDGI